MTQSRIFSCYVFLLFCRRHGICHPVYVSSYTNLVADVVDFILIRYKYLLRWLRNDAIRQMVCCKFYIDLQTEHK